MHIPILAYHKVQKKIELGLSYTTPKQFEKQVEYLHRNNFKTVSISDLTGGHTKLPEKSVIITFDDSYESIFYNAYPILKKYGFTASIFVITKFVGKKNTWDYHSDKFGALHCSWQQIAELFDNGWEVGSHTVTHSNLKKLTIKQIWYEIKYSKDVIEHHLGQPINVISYPFGWFDKRVIEIVRQAGYSAGCTLGHDVRGIKQYPFALFRRGVYVFEPLSVFRNKLVNNFFSSIDDYRQRAFAKAAQVVSIHSFFPRV